MNNIKWCLKQKKGIELIKPNEELKKAYLQKNDKLLQLFSCKV